MKIFTSFEELKKAQLNIVYALGTFDGLHRGHQTVISRAVEEGKKYQAKTVVVTFDAHPLSILRPELEPPALLQKTDKKAVLESWDVDCSLVLHMDQKLLSLPASDFIQSLLSAGQVKAIVTGENFTFGAKGVGTPTTIKEWTKDTDIKVITLDLMESEIIECAVSSTSIRKAIKEGNIEVANKLLGRPYSFTGEVILGDQRGRTLGYPTLNFLFPKEMALPPDGVYVNLVYIDGKRYSGVGNMGDNPTFANQYHRFEVHVFDFDEMIYGKEVRVEFLHFLRKEVKFNTLDALIKQMDIDGTNAKEYIKNYIEERQ